MSYELIQSLLTDAAIAVLFTAAILPFAHAFHPVTPADKIAPLHPATPHLAVVQLVERCRVAEAV